MERRKNLTNEIVTKKFQNQFDLVNYAISVATHLIESGRDTQAHSWTENPALQALDEIESGRDKFEEIDVEEEEEEVVFEEEVTPKKRQSKKAEKALSE
jgi:DNA-directed RNA polymerase subunit omega